jgi:hypothetical protein
MKGAIREVLRGPPRPSDGAIKVLLVLLII